MRAALANAFFLLIVLTSTGVDSRGTIPIVLDTDIGQDFDDTWALSYLLTATQNGVQQSLVSSGLIEEPIRGEELSKPLFDVKMVLSSYANTTGRAFLTAKFLQAVGRTDVPVGVGAATPFNANNLYRGVGAQMHWVPDSFDPKNDFNGSFYYDGLAQLKTLLETEASETNPWIILCIAPMANMGLLFEEAPHLKRRVVFVTMGGSIFHGYGGSNGPSGEHNIVTVLNASLVVYNHTVETSFAGPICAAPLDTTDWFQIYGENYKKFYDGAASGRNSSVASVLLENFKVWNDFGGCYPGMRPCNPETSSSILYDCQAAFQAGIVAHAATLQQQSPSSGQSMPHPSFPSSSPSWARTGCNSIPWMVTTTLPIIVDENDGITKPWFGGRTASSSLAGAQLPVLPVVETISWTGGQWNGTYELGAHIVEMILRG